MWGLIRKDLKNLKQQAKVFLIITALYLILGIQSGDFMMLGGFVIMIAAILPVTALAYDEKSKWEEYALTMPVTRAQLVLSKYLLGLLLSGGATVIISIGQSFFQTAAEAVPATLLMFGVGLLFTAILLPLTFKFGVEKARIFFILVVVLPTVGGFVLSKLQFQMPELTMAPELLTLCGVAGVLLLYGLSVLLSLQIYKKKEW